MAIDSGHWPRWPVVRPTDNSASIILTPEQILATWAGHMGWPNEMATCDLDGVAPEQCDIDPATGIGGDERHALHSHLHRIHIELE